MIANYLKVAVRNLMRNKTFSAINILGLAIGMACCMLILLYIQDELSYDRHHENADRIFRLADEVRVSGKTYHLAVTPYQMGPALVQDYPTVVDAVRFFRNIGEKSLVGTGEEYFYETGVMFTDSNIFRVFDFPLSNGDPQTALREPYSIVLSAAMARKYFDDNDPMGRPLSVDRKLYRVTGILKEPTYKTHLKFDFLATPIESDDDGWIAHSYYTYLLLRDENAASELEQALPDFVERHIRERDKARRVQMKPFLQTLTDIHLHSSLEYEVSANGDIRYVYLFIAIALFVLLLACINYTILSTGHCTYRSKEVGLRKVVGAKRRQMIFQFLVDSTLIASISTIVAVVFVETALPTFGAFTERNLNLEYLRGSGLVLGFIGIVLFTGVLSGSYPAIFLSSFQPVAALKGLARAGSNKLSLRRTLVVLQFAISIVLLIGTGVVYDQASFIRNKRLGFQKEHVLVMPYGDADAMEGYKNAVSAYNSVLDVSASSTVPGRMIASHFFRPVIEGGSSDGSLFNVVFAGYGFISTFGFELSEGRAFSKEFGSDRFGTFMLNQAAMRKLGWASCEGKKLAHVYTEGGEFKVNVQGDVVGVVKDFHYRSLHHEIEPLVIMLVNRGWVNYLSIRIRPEDVAGTLDFLKTRWRDVMPDTPVEYSFLDTSFDQLYRTEARLGTLLGVFSILAIVVAGLGLFGLASISVQQRTKEIGIRKAVGASVANVVLLLSREYVVLVGIANLVAWPIAYYVMDRWLENFAYRVDPAIATFTLGGLLSLSIALLTVGYKTCKAAVANPVDALRYE
ncbi:MAG: ABC transporter permease [Gemmatimonadota bacterium]|nr:ABC transporter permease [Gemmatimonadota bacterium]